MNTSTGIKSIIFIASIALAAPLPTSLPQWIVDNRPITSSWPGETIAWIQKHSVPPAIKKQIEHSLLQEPIISCLLDVYNHYYLHPDQIKLLEQHGITFFSKWNIFESKHVPGYIIKMASPRNGHSELLNLGRIAHADELRKSIKKWHMQSYVTIPEKYTYIVPPLPGVTYQNQPKVLIVSKKVSFTKKAQRKLSHIVAKLWLKLKRASDIKKSNLGLLEHGVALVDTEPWNNRTMVPGFTKIMNVVRKPHQAAHAVAEFTPTHNTPRPATDHNHAGSWTCITPQGIIVRSPWLKCVTCWCDQAPTL